MPLCPQCVISSYHAVWSSHLLSPQSLSFLSLPIPSLLLHNQTIPLIQLLYPSADRLKIRFEVRRA